MVEFLCLPWYSQCFHFSRTTTKNPSTTTRIVINNLILLILPVFVSDMIKLLVNTRAYITTETYFFYHSFRRGTSLWQLFKSIQFENEEKHDSASNKPNLAGHRTRIPSARTTSPRSASFERPLCFLHNSRPIYTIFWLPVFRSGAGSFFSSFLSINPSEQIQSLPENEMSQNRSGLTVFMWVYFFTSY